MLIGCQKQLKFRFSKISDSFAIPHPPISYIRKLKIFDTSGDRNGAKWSSGGGLLKPTFPIRSAQTPIRSTACKAFRTTLRRPTRPTRSTLTNQKVIHTNTSATLLDLSYGYDRGNSVGSLSGKTGQLTRITNNLDHNKDRSFEYDAIGRLTAAKGGVATGATGVTANWSQTYAYDRYGNRTSVTANGITADSNNVPADGIPSLGFDTSSNRINSSGSQYDNAGNLIRSQNTSGVWLRFESDAAGRLIKVRDDSNNVLETYTYGADRNRLINETSTGRTYYAWGGSSPLVEYTEATSGTTPAYSRSYTYAGSRLLSTATVVSASEVTEFHHPDRLGTKLVTNPTANTNFEQSTLPFGTELTAEEAGTGSTNLKFTSYDRSAGTGLDYAVNRTHSPSQGRFTQADPIGVEAGSKDDPQSLNLFSYVTNDPLNLTDSTGLDPVASAQARANELLKFKPCADIFKGKNPQVLLKNAKIRVTQNEPSGFNNVTIRFNKEGWDPEHAAVTVYEGPGKGIYVNPEGAVMKFVPHGVPIGFGISVSSDYYPALALIHELGHLARVIPDDAISRDQSYLNNLNVWFSVLRIKSFGSERADNDEPNVVWRRNTVQALYF